MHRFKVLLKMVQLNSQFLALVFDLLQLGQCFTLGFEVIPLHEVCQLLRLRNALVRVAVPKKVLKGLLLLALLWLSLGLLRQFGNLVLV